jgi:hypothetical protein
MGRYYNGDISGKFWFGIQDSNDIHNLITMDSYKYYNWKKCGCCADIEGSNYCNCCYNTLKEHIDDVKNDDDYEDNCLYYEECCQDYNIDKSVHYQELVDSMSELKKEINDEIIEEFDKIPQDDNILDAFTGVFDNSLKLLNSLNKEIQEKQEKKKLETLVARYTLGYQIEYCLRKNETCNVSCEF